MFGMLRKSVSKNSQSMPTPAGTTGGTETIADKIDPLDTSLDNDMEYVDPPIDFDTITRMWNESALHRSCLIFKAQSICKGYRPHEANKFYMEQPNPKSASKDIMVRYVKNMIEFYHFCSLDTMYRFTLDYLRYGNSVFEKLFPKKGGDDVAGLRFRNFRGIRVGKKDGQYFQVRNGEIIDTFSETLIHLLMPAPESDYYGLPEYLPVYDDVQLLRSGKKLRQTFYDKNGYLGGVLVSNLRVTDVDEKGLSQTEQNWADSIVEAVTKEGQKVWLLNLRGDPNVEDVSKAVSYFHMSQTLKDDDYKSTNENSKQEILHAHRVDPDLMGTTRGEGGVANLEKVKENFSDQLEFYQNKITLEVNSVVDPENWIAFDPFYKTESN